MTEIIKEIDGYRVIEYEKTNIYVIENVLDDVLCNKFINLIETLPLTKVDHKKSNNVKCHTVNIDDLLNMDPDFYYHFSTCDTIYKKLLDNKIPFTNKLNGLSVCEIEKYNNIINEKMLVVNNIVSNMIEGLNLEYNSGYILRKINGKTRCHVDGFDTLHKSNINFIKNNKMGDYNMIRNASIIFTLNDNYDGGIFRFPYHNVSLKLKKGSVIIFPPYWTHPHETDKLENNTFRYTINTWSCVNI